MNDEIIKKDESNATRPIIPPPPPGAPPEVARIEQYKAYLADLGNIGTRHENSRKFYLSVLAALAAYLSLTGKPADSHVTMTGVVLVGLAGIILCANWIWHLAAFNYIYRGMFIKIREMEQSLPFHLYGRFTEEDKKELAKRETEGCPRRYGLAFVDQATALLFILLLAAIIVAALVSPEAIGFPTSPAP